ncbi:Hypothetical protein SRAE_2000520700 [Strongyloides ratti]|uniref:EGF-like domain-containing protein n=1 Tax=Strongyloides ratti TaxID=34506 RepID=A0A090LL85_STRRB|nr:Hypothetical protein SRAE_2000520700 [Strongyloides ratti]CEF70579.1 Hypothetical protein SRAE_2000520700 [Strongyloides ratti]
MYLIYYLFVITIIITPFLGSTIIRSIPDPLIHENSPELYYNKHCKNNKCGEFGECVLMVQTTANNFLDDKYLCRCKKCYGGKYCNINYCLKNETFFTSTRIILLILILFVFMLYIYGVISFILFYLRYIYKIKNVMKANKNYYIDSLKGLNNGNEKSTTIIILRKVFKFWNYKNNKIFKKNTLSKKSNVSNSTSDVTNLQSTSNSIEKSKKDIIDVKKNDNKSFLSQDSNTNTVQLSKVNEDINTTLPTTIITETKKVEIDKDTTKTSDKLPPKVLTPYPTKYKMVSLFGIEQLQKLGVIQSSKNESTKLPNDANK